MNDLDYERWRGHVDERLQGLKEGQDALPKYLDRQLDRLGDRLEDALKTHVDDDNKSFKDHDERLTKLEHQATRALVIGTLMWLVFSAITAAAATYFFS